MANLSEKEKDKINQKVPDDEVDEASMESFPASDPPGWIHKKHPEEKKIKKNNNKKQP